MLISLFTGSETFPSGACKLHVLGIPTQSYPRGGKGPIHIGLAAKDNNPSFPVRQTAAQKLPAAAGSSVTLGTWWRSTYDVPEGMLLEVFGSINASGSSFGSSTGRTTAGAVLIQMRAHAALRRITFNRQPDRMASVQSLTVEGRFDIVQLRDLAEHRPQVTSTDIMHLSANAVRTLFSSTVIDAEVTSRPELVRERIKTPEGNSVEIVKTQHRRALDLD